MELVTSQNGNSSSNVVPSADYVPAASSVKDINDDYDIKEVNTLKNQIKIYVTLSVILLKEKKTRFRRLIINIGCYISDI